MNEIQISCCDYDEKLEKWFKKKISGLEFENLFFYKKDLSLIKKENIKKIKIIDCLVENEIKFSNNLKPIIKIEEKTIEYELKNISLFELGKNLIMLFFHFLFDQQPLLFYNFFFLLL